MARAWAVMARSLPPRRKYVRLVARVRRWWFSLPERLQELLPPQRSLPTPEVQEPAKVVGVEELAVEAADRATTFLHRINRRPPIARFLFLCAAGVFGVAAAIIVARNEIALAQRTPELRVFNPRMADARLQLTRQRGEILRQMVLAYTQAHGQAPDSLSRLVPEYLPGVPCPLVGSEPWEYANAGQGAFSLSFRSWTFPTLTRERLDQDGRWALAE